MLLFEQAMQYIDVTELHLQGVVLSQDTSMSFGVGVHVVEDDQLFKARYARQQHRQLQHKNRRSVYSVQAAAEVSDTFRIFSNHSITHWQF